MVGKITYNVTEESLMDRLNTIIHLACLSIPEIPGKVCDYITFNIMHLSHKI